MPRGGKVNLKGRDRHFTNPEELERQRRVEERNWRAKKEESSEESESKDGSSGSGSESGSKSGSDAEGAKKGKAPIAEIENLNRIAVKKVKKVGQVDTNQVVEPVLSRREREEIQKQRAAEHYRRLHSQGKTDEARADLARLSIIRQQREEAAKKRDEEKRLKDAEKAAAKLAFKKK